ncbi:15259_t:CDS:2, partial [Dentiscutata erythropus]
HGDHSLDPLTKKFGLTHRILTEPMLADIEFWTTNGNLTEQNVNCKTATLINYLIEHKSKDIRWTINWYVDPATNSLVSLFWMMPEQYELYLQYIEQMLMNNETLESFEWVFDSLIKGTNIFLSVIITDNDLAITNIMSDTYHIHCIYHIGQNLLKNLKSKLGSEYNDFIKAWYKMRNTISQTEFDYLWDSLLEQYPASASYLNRSLGSQKHRWALSYIPHIFTGEIQSTQRVEGQTMIIKSAVNSYTFILDVFKKLKYNLIVYLL